jgi:hypothetical protein
MNGFKLFLGVEIACACRMYCNIKVDHSLDFRYVYSLVDQI